jgi:hypothetical protein
MYHSPPERFKIGDVTLLRNPGAPLYFKPFLQQFLDFWQTLWYNMVVPARQTERSGRCTADSPSLPAFLRGKAGFAIEGATT